MGDAHKNGGQEDVLSVKLKLFVIILSRYFLFSLFHLLRVETVRLAQSWTESKLMQNCMKNACGASESTSTPVHVGAKLWWYYGNMFARNIFNIAMPYNDQLKTSSGSCFVQRLKLIAIEAFCADFKGNCDFWPCSQAEKYMPRPECVVLLLNQ